MITCASFAHMNFLSTNRVISDNYNKTHIKILTKQTKSIHVDSFVYGDAHAHKCWRILVGSRGFQGERNGSQSSLTEYKGETDKN